MCGIVGLIPKAKHGFNYKEQLIFSQMLNQDSIRGMDATGVITCHKNGDFGIMKEAVEASYFIPSWVGSDLDKDLFKNGCAVIGHNRHKTVGENKDENAHPFVVNKTFAMVHNGTLRNHKTIADTVVDSEALAIMFKTAMEEEDFLKAVSEAVWKINGAFACVWYDQKRHQVGMIRNSQRPLWLYETADSILFGSEFGLLSWIAGRNDAKYVSHKQITTDTLYLFDMKKGGGSVEEFPLAVRPTPIYHQVGQKTGKTTTKVTELFPKNSLNKVYGPGEETRCSKNQFKRFRNTLIGTSLLFDLDDWVEKHLFNKEGDATQLILLGTSTNGAHDLCDVRHCIKGEINTKTLGLSVDEVDFQSKWIGTVKDVAFDGQMGQVLIELKDIAPVVVKEPTVH